MWQHLIFTIAIYPVIYGVLYLVARSEKCETHKSRPLNPTGIAIRLAIAFVLFVFIFMPLGINPGIPILIFSALPLLVFELFGFLGLLGLPSVFVAEWIVSGTIIGGDEMQKCNIKNHSANKQKLASEMIGKTGKSLTTLRPTGTIVVEQQEYEARAQSGLIQNGTTIRVVNQHGHELIVREDTVPFEDSEKS